VIQQSQLASAAAEQETKATRGTGKPSLPAPTMVDKWKGKKKNKLKGNIGTIKERELDIVSRFSAFTDSLRSRRR
jgi:hypothetical protein